MESSGRFLDKNKLPSPNEIKERLGDKAYERLKILDSFLNYNYDIVRELKFPFGNGYGWGYKYAVKSKLLCYVFFEKDSFTVTITIGKNEVNRLMKALPSMLPKTQELWAARYPCGEGGWIHYSVTEQNEIADIEKLIGIKKKPFHTADG